MQHPFLLFCCAALLVGCQPPKPSNGGSTGLDTVPPPPRTVVPHFASPEGAVWDGQHLYISNVGPQLDPMAKDGDGFLLRLNAQGTEVLDSALFAGLKLNAPKGMAILGGRLYVSDIDRVVAVDLATGSEAAVIDFSSTGAQFLNDVAVKDDSTLFISATDLGAIFELNVRSQQFRKLPVKGLNGPNGLLYDSEEGKLYCAEYGGDLPDGRLLRIDVRGGQTQVLHPHRGNLDGLVRLRNGNLAFSDWHTKSVHQLDLRSNVLSRIATDSIQGPGDIGYSVAEDRLWIPRMMENGLLVLESAQLK
jgi:DNA-binding beta-propeller fold protein YncE